VRQILPRIIVKFAFVRFNTESSILRKSRSGTLHQQKRRRKAAGGMRDSLCVSPFDVKDDAILAARTNISESVDSEAPRTTIF
jgi:hypothetical protein